jgi:2-polyprenyl-6-methoxyphenol hydroxylase-like FAD-dependent oxidoreductase
VEGVVVGRVLVVGAGIAGCATALALDKAGFEVEVYEAHPDSGADIGAFLTLASNGMLALAQLGVAQSVAEVGFDLMSMRLTGDTGDEIATVPLRGHADRLTRYRCMRRVELCRVLQSAVVRRGIPVQHGARLDSVVEGGVVEGGVVADGVVQDGVVEGGGVTACFADGRAVEGDLLIGADGLNSTVRALIDPAVAPPRYVGQRVFYGYATDVAPPSAPGRIDMVRGSASAFGYTVSPEGETSWFARVSGERLVPGDIAGAALRDLLVPLLRRDATAAAGIVEATGDRLMVTNAHDLPSVPRWHTDRMLIIGDAAHAASPATGQGASMALEDAVVLAKALRDNGTIGEALAVYERLRRPRVEANIVASARLTPGRPQPGPGNARPQPSLDEDDELRRQLDWDTPF